MLTDPIRQFRSKEPQPPEPRRDVSRRVRSCLLGLAWIIVPASAAVSPGQAQDAAAAPVLRPLSTVSSETVGRSEIALLIGLGSAAVLSKKYENSRWMASKLDGAPTVFDVTVDLADRYGDGLTMGSSAIALSYLGRQFGSERAQMAGDGIGKSLVAAWSATWALKIIVGAKRPNGGAYSFPSGHTSTAFAAAPVLHEYFGDWVGYSAYAMAGMTAVARMEDNKHHLSDVLAGAAIGVVAGRTFGIGNGMSFGTSRSGSGLGIQYEF